MRNDGVDLLQLEDTNTPSAFSPVHKKSHLATTQGEVRSTLELQLTHSDQIVVFFFFHLTSDSLYKETGNMRECLFYL